MTKERQIEILMQDRCTKAEAERFLKNGTTIFDDITDYIEGWLPSEDEIEEVNKMVETKIPYGDWGIVEDNGHTYYIMYVL